jgi:hypothetical protein
MPTTVHGQINPTTGRIERRVVQTTPTTSDRNRPSNAELREYSDEVKRQAVQKQVEWDRLPHWKQEQLKMAAYLRKLDQLIAQENAQLASVQRERRRARDTEALERYRQQRAALEHQRAQYRQLHGRELGTPPGSNGLPSVADSMDRPARLSPRQYALAQQRQAAGFSDYRTRA